MASSAAPKEIRKPAKPERTLATSRMIGFGTICNFTDPRQRIPFSVPFVPSDFNENATVITGRRTDGVAVFPSSGPCGGTASPVHVRGGSPKTGPWNGIHLAARKSLTQFSATLVVASRDARHLKAQLVFVPDDARTPPNVKTGVVRVSNPTRHSAIHIITPFQFQPVAPGTFQVRFATTRRHGRAAKPVTVTVLENDTFSVVQYQTLPATFQPGEY
jgi:hypothetical protein